MKKLIFLSALFSWVGCTNTPIRAVGPSVLPGAHLGVAYQAALSVDGGKAPYQVAVIEGTVPVGLSFQGLSLEGVPTAFGLSNFEIEVSDADKQLFRARVAVTVEADPIVLSPIAPITSDQGAAVSVQVVAIGGVPPLRFSVAGGGPLWPGLAIDEDGLIQGTPTSVGTGRATVEVHDSGDHVARGPVEIDISAVGPIITTSTLPRAHQGENYVFNLAAAHGSAALQYRVSQNALPDGLSLSASGQISGVPTAAGRTTFGIEVVDAGDLSDARLYTLDVLGPLLITTPALASAATGQAYAAVMDARGGLPPYRWSTTGALPAGIALGADGTWGGTTNQLGEFPVVVKVEDAEGSSRSARYALRVGQRFSHEVSPMTSFPPVCTSTRVSYQTVDIEVAESAAIAELEVELDLSLNAPRPLPWRVLLFAPDGRWAALCGDGAGIPGGSNCPSRGVRTTYPTQAEPDTTLSTFQGMNARGRWRLAVGVVRPAVAGGSCEAQGLIRHFALHFGDDRSTEPYVLVDGYTTNNRVTDPFVRVRGGHQVGPVQLQLMAHLYSAGANGVREAGLGDDVLLPASFEWSGDGLPSGTSISTSGVVASGRVTGEGTVTADDGAGHRVEKRLLVTPPDWNDLVRVY
ncbi:MAG: Ig domain-containing protein [Myxococcota bacterium]